MQTTETRKCPTCGGACCVDSVLDGENPFKCPRCEGTGAVVVDASPLVRSGAWMTRSGAAPGTPLRNTTDFMDTENASQLNAIVPSPASSGSAIPDRHLDFCREVGRLAAAHGLSRLSMTLQPGFRDEWLDQIEATWEQGRHGEDAGVIHVSSTVRVHTKISPNDPKLSDCP